MCMARSLMLRMEWFYTEYAVVEWLFSRVSILMAKHEWCLC